MTRVAVLDDWQHVAATSADWAPLKARAEVVFFHGAFASEDEAAATLADFDIILAMRERTAFPAALIARLPKLRMFNMTGARAGTIDSAAMAAPASASTWCCRRVRAASWAPPISPA